MNLQENIYMLGQQKTSNLVIKLASEAEALELYELEKYWAKTPGYLVSTVNELSPENYIKSSQRLNNSPNSRHLVAMIENKVVGHVLIEEGSLHAIKHIGRLSITVHKNHINEGIGSQLLQFILSWARNESQLKKIELLVRATNSAAITLYKKYGFEEEGRHKNRIQVAPGTYIDDIMMGLWLSA